MLEQRIGALPKMAALLAEAAHMPEPTGMTTLKSGGVCLVYGRGQSALDVAAELADRLSVTVLLSDAGGRPAARHRLGADLQGPHPKRHPGISAPSRSRSTATRRCCRSSKGALEFVMPRDGARSTCDIVFDMSGGTPLFADAQRRDGYLHVDPSHPAAVARAMFKVTDLVGEFEKPLYVSYDAGICAHARSQKVGCTNCLDNCPTGAITPNGDHVAIDPALCGGCGSCSAVCPTGAVSYAYPQRADLVARLGVLLRTYRAAGGARPVVLFHDEKHGSPLIAAMARLGKGLPPNVLPLSLFSVLQLGHEALASALAFGAEQIVVLAPPEHPAELAALESQIGLTAAYPRRPRLPGPAHASVDRARSRRRRSPALRPAGAADAAAGDVHGHRLPSATSPAPHWPSSGLPPPSPRT